MHADFFDWPAESLIVSFGDANLYLDAHWAFENLNECFFSYVCRSSLLYYYITILISMA